MAKSLHEVINEYSQRNIETKPKNYSMAIKTIQAKVRAGKSIFQVEAKAEMLAKKLNAPDSIPFFCKCLYNLPEDFIWTTLELSQAGRIQKPLNYFIKVCRCEMTRLGID